MGFLDSFFRRGSGEPASMFARVSGHSSGGYEQSNAPIGSGDDTIRRDLLRVVLRDILQSQGIPADWLAAEMLTAHSRSRGSGIHLRIVIRHWDPKLMLHAPALENLIVERVSAVDIWAPSWLRGISWQFELPDSSPCPPMPPAGSWLRKPQE